MLLNRGAKEVLILRIPPSPVAARAFLHSLKDCLLRKTLLLPMHPLVTPTLYLGLPLHEHQHSQV